MIDRIKESVSSSEAGSSTRRKGHHTNRPNKISDEDKEFIIAHIGSFPSEAAHYSRNRKSESKISCAIVISWENVSIVHRET